MTAELKEPILQHWTTPEPATVPGVVTTAAEVNRRLGQLEIDDIEPDLVPYLAAAAAELALVAGIPWRFGVDDPPVALLRMIAKVGIRHADAGGAHTTRLFDRLGTW
jgi:hypothetical protein